MDMEELKNQADELINGNINSYPALSREAAGKAILMLIEKIKILEADYYAILKTLNIVKKKNARYREALERIANYGCGDGFNEFMSAIISAQEVLKGE